MITISNKALCSGCTACQNVCPKNCIRMVTDSEGFKYPEVDPEKCINCGACERVCPVTNIKKEDIDGYPRAFLGYDRDKYDRINSAAGGAFFAIAEGFMEKTAGAVVGAAYDDNFTVKHIVVRSTSELRRLQKSKYVQSDMNDCFSEVKNLLTAGTPVLFSGTTCQVAGLKKFIPEKFQKNLFTIDLSCYGVPSPAVFDEYLKYQAKKHGSISKVIIRDKELHRHSFRVGYGILFKNGTKYFAPHGVDPMARIFYSHIALRPICYECPFKTVGRISDLTLGDCWYPEFFIKGFEDKYGITMILQHSEKGRTLLEHARTLKITECDAEKLIKVNGGMLFRSSAKHPRREEFFSDFNKGMEFRALADKYAPKNADSIVYKVSQFAKEHGLMPAGMQKKKRQKEVDRRCDVEIPDEARKKQLL